MLPVRKILPLAPTLNLRSIGAIGYDMDYTLVHYHVREWESRAYEWTRQNLVAPTVATEHAEVTDACLLVVDPLLWPKVGPRAIIH